MSEVIAAMCLVRDVALGIFLRAADSCATQPKEV